MNILRQSVRSLQRDWRSGELRLIAAAVVIAVASLTSIHFFTDRVKQATEMHATELLAADLVIGSRDPISADLINLAHDGGLTTTRTTAFRSVVVAGDNMQMSEVKAVEPGYPIRGNMRTAGQLFGQETTTSDLPVPGTVWAEPRVLQMLGIDVGDSIQLGNSSLTVSRVLTYEPDRGGDFFNLAPRVLMNLADLPATQLILPGSRVGYRLLVGGQIDAVGEFRRSVEDRFAREFRIQSIRDARPELRTALDRAEQFLGLAVLVSIALAGLAVAMSAQRYAVRHFDNCAIMRCLGTQQRDIARLYLLQLLILSVASSLAGCMLGYLAQEVISFLVAGLVKDALPSASLKPVGIGLLAGIVTVLGFAMPQIMRLRSVSPLRVLRRDMEPVPIRSMTTYAFAVIALALLSPWRAGNYLLTVYVLAGILVTGLVLMFCTLILINCLNRLRSRVGVASRYGLANIARRKNQSIAQIIGIGLGVMVMILLTLIRTDLLANWRDRIPEGTPNYFLMNIQPDKVEPLREFLSQYGLQPTYLNPMILARLSAINGTTVNPDEYADDRSRRRAERTYNLTWSADLHKSNRVIEGRWWDGSGDSEVEFSLEQEIAGELGVGLDDTLTFTVAGKDVSGRITSLRWIDWDSLDVNFFVVANPGSLDGFPGTWVTSLYAPTDRRQVMIELIREFQNVTVIDVDAILVQVRAIMNQVIRTVEFVFGFTLLAGMVVLFAALQTTHDDRIYESALLSSLGANRRQILASLAAEFVCLGLLSGCLAAFAATVIEAVLADAVFRMDVVINPWAWLVAPLVCVSLILAGGLAGTRKVLETPPIVVLKNV